jgi:tetratricopeptide (TPR) repeat protein
VFPRLWIGSVVLALVLPLLPAQTGPNPEAAIESALRQRNFEQALQLLQPQLEKSRSSARLWTLDGIAHSGLGRTKEALSAYDNALKIAPDYLPALEGAAELEYKVGSGRARPLLDHIVKLRPENSTAHAMLAVLAYKRHDCALAVTHFAASKAVISAQPAALAEYGSCLVDLQRAEDALPIFERLLNLEPGDAHARYNFAVVQSSAHHPQAAIATLQPLLQFSQSDPDVLDLASSAYEETGDTPTAVKLLREAIVLDPKKVRYYVDFATISFAHQSFQVGVDMVDAGLKQNPNAAPLYVARGILYIQLGQYEKGEADFESANKVDPRQTSGAVAEGLAQMQQSNLDQALATVRSQHKNHPQDAFLHYMEAQILFQRGVDPGTPEFKEALAAANRSVQLKPDLVLARDLLGNLYLRSGDTEQAIAQSRRALQENPSDQEALYHLIQALRKGKDTNRELPGLVKRLAALRQESRSAEASGNRYKLYEPSADDSSK